ncbi:BTAD domain-containing putative transcriptional regulator [Lentzea sp. NPDC005914]|uniref:BTAD domain-containing putative transcriptional regulator n=1 Tax=Lentzea sp. NPDC005914 TaxID=3154572 RepID=UPI0033F99FE3
MRSRAGSFGAGSFGRLLQQQRIQLGLTQRDLAASSGVSVRAVRYIENGTVRRPRPESVRSLAAAVGIDPGRFGLASESPADDVRLGVLGRLTVVAGGRPVEISSLKQRCLLGLLALQANEAVSREEIIDVLWGEAPPATCVDLVHSYTSRLRQILRQLAPRAPQITATHDGYRLTARPDQVDVLRFTGLLATAGASTEPEFTVDLLEEALTTWRGSVLADTTSALWQHPAAIAAGQRRLAAVLHHADLAIRLHRPERAVEQLSAVATTEPLHEGLHARLMSALAASGQRAKALHLFTEIRGRLTTELGIDPAAELRAAHLTILRSTA